MKLSLNTKEVWSVRGKQNRTSQRGDREAQRLHNAHKVSRLTKPKILPTGRYLDHLALSLRHHHINIGRSLLLGNVLAVPSEPKTEHILHRLQLKNPFPTFLQLQFKCPMVGHSCHPQCRTTKAIKHSLWQADMRRYRLALMSILHFLREQMTRGFQTTIFPKISNSRWTF